MSQFLEQVITCLQTENTKEKLQDCIGFAGDLLGRSVSSSYISGFAEIDSENVTVAESEKIKQSLLDVLNRISDMDIAKSVIWALRKSGDSSLKEVYINYLHNWLQTLLLYNSGVFQALLALDDIDEDVLEWNAGSMPEFTSQSLMDVDKNIRQARRYLTKHDIVVPW